MGDVHLFCLNDNPTIRGIAVKCGGESSSEDGIFGFVFRTSWPNCLSVAEEVTEESKGLLEGGSLHAA